MAVSDHASGSSLRAFDIAMIVLPTVAVVLRFWSRALPRGVKGHRFWWDDWVIFLTLPLSIAACSLQIAAVNLGLGQHVKTISPANSTQLFKVLWSSYFMSDLALTLSKTSVLLFYARIFSIRSTWFKWGLWLAHTLNFLWWLSSIARCLLFCTPVDKYWNHKKPGHCRGGGALYIGSAVPSVVIDILILLLPLPIIARLSMKASRKALVTGVFVCGYLVIAISLGRLITSLTSEKLLNEDVTYYGINLFFWVAAEPAVSIIGCCLPIIFYLARRCITYGPASLFTSKPLSTSSASRSNTMWPKPAERRRLPSEHSLELTERTFADDAASVEHTANGTKRSMYDYDKKSMENDYMRPAFDVHKDVQVRSHEEF
ncbi:hypothetical protein ACLMJK_007021 [Lecanora helva]